jgi:uncharacterized heparinase superfamily protein
MLLGRALDALARSRALRAAARAAPATGFVLRPEGRPPGSFARGRRLAAGSIHLAGRVLEARDPFGVPPPSPGFAEALHGWGWLDDLAACGEPAAREAARAWLAVWIDGFGMGRGPGWRADLAGRRLLRWVEHAVFLTAGTTPQARSAYYAATAVHAAFLARRWHTAPPGLPRIEALTGWLVAALSLDGLEGGIDPALAALTDAAAARIGPDGGIAERNPEALLWTAAHLAWARATLAEAGRRAPAPLDTALLAAARALRALRHRDGGLARFHGGGAGPEGLADRVIALAAPGDFQRPVQAMGFARMDGGRTSLILDAAPPPDTDRAQAAVLGFELTSGRRPVVVGCGAGADFGADWAAAGRSAAGASTLALDGGTPAPTRVDLHRSDERGATTLLATHDGWVASHGLTHTRELRLSRDGRTVMGEDALAALAPAERARFDRLVTAGGGRGPDAALRFHLHPDVEARPDTGGAKLVLASGEIWLFRFDGPARLDLEPSVWLEPGRRAPRPCRQIVLRGRVAGAGLRIGWTLAKAQATPLAIRDTGRDTGLAADDAALPPGFTDEE